MPSAVPAITSEMETIKGVCGAFNKETLRRLSLHCSRDYEGRIESETTLGAVVVDPWPILIDFPRVEIVACKTETHLPAKREKPVFKA